MASFSTLGFTAAVSIPALLLLGMNFLTDAPAEWARGALTAYASVCAMLIVGAAAPAVGGWLTLLFALAAVVALSIGGPWGLAIAAAILIGLVLAQFTAAAWPFHVALVPILAAAAVIAAIRHIVFRL